MSEDVKHAVLSASGSSKWLNCTPSVRLEEQFKNETSDFMREGTLAHSVAELVVNSYITKMTKRTFNTRLNKLKADDLYKDEMLKSAEDYLEYIKEILFVYDSVPYITVEKTVSYNNYAKEGFGTADCIIIGKNCLHVIDFKYGKGVAVSADHNTQMMLYALGALEEYGLIYSIDKVVVHVFQPRIQNYSMFEIDKDELEVWGEITVKSASELAFVGAGEFKTGDHCRFCKAKGKCGKRARENLEVVEETKKDIKLLSNAEIGEILYRVKDVASWIKDLEKQALTEVLKGEEVPGWKVVEGRSNRTLSDIDKALEVLKENGFDEALLFERKVLGITGLEAVVGKKEFSAMLGDYIIKPKGSPTLVKNTDKREEYKKVSAAEEFAEKVEEK